MEESGRTSGGGNLRARAGGRGGERALGAEKTVSAKAQQMEGAKRAQQLQETVWWERMFREMGASSECWAQGPLAESEMKTTAGCRAEWGTRTTG